MQFELVVVTSLLLTVAALDVTPKKGVQLDLPVVLPPYFRVDDNATMARGSYGDCLFYLEGVDVVTMDASRKKTDMRFVSIHVDQSNANFLWNDTYVSCPDRVNDTAKFSFEVELVLTSTVKGDYNLKRVTVMDEGTKIHFSMTIQYKWGWFELLNVTLLEDLVVNSTAKAYKSLSAAAREEPQNLKNVGLIGVHNQSWTCSLAQAIFFPAGEISYNPDKVTSNTSNGHLIGIRLVRAQIQPMGIAWAPGGIAAPPRFTSHEVVDCDGMLSIAFWHAAIVISILFTALVFGVFMLNTINTPDRFDNPKKKFIVIGSKD